MKRSSQYILFYVAMLVMGLPAQGAIVSATWDPSVKPPPAVLRSYPMVPFFDQNSSAGSDNLVVQAVSPSSGIIEFSTPVRHYKITGTSSPWDTWIHRSTDDAYCHAISGSRLLNSANNLALSLPKNTKAFYLFVESKVSQNFTFSVDSSQGSLTFPLQGNGGAMGIAFYTDSPSDHIKSITVANPGNHNDVFVVGAFGINGKNPESEKAALPLRRARKLDGAAWLWGGARMPAEPLFFSQVNPVSVPDGAIHPVLFATILLGLGSLSHLIKNRRQ